MSHIPFHPAPGFGELLPGEFVVPQNPITMAERGVSRVPHLAEFMPGTFSVPQNPIRNELAGMSSLRPGVKGLGCGGSGSCGCGGKESGSCGCSGGMSGLGDVSDFMAGLSTPVLIGGAVLLYLMFFGPGAKKRSSELAQAKSEYRKRVSGIKSKGRLRLSAA